MATTTTQTIATPLRDAWERFFSTLARRFEAHMRIQGRRDEIEALERKTDDELAQLGIFRNEIAIHVFRDKFYT